MKFWIYIERAALHIAVEKGNIQIIQLLMTSKRIDINIQSILIVIFISLTITNFTKFSFICYHYISFICFYYILIFYLTKLQLILFNSISRNFV